MEVSVVTKISVIYNNMLTHALIFLESLLGLHLVLGYGDTETVVQEERQQEVSSVQRLVVLWSICREMGRNAPVCPIQQPTQTPFWDVVPWLLVN